VERELLISLVSSDRTSGNGSKLHQSVEVDWTLGSISLLGGWSNTATGLLERWLMPQACQCSRGIWTISLTTCYSFQSALKWSGSWTS